MVELGNIAHSPMHSFVKVRRGLVRVIVAQLHNIDEAFDFGSQLLRSILDSRAPVADLIRRGVRHIQCRDRLAHHIRT